MGTSRRLLLTFAVFTAGSLATPAAHAQLPELEKEIIALGKLFEGAEKKKPCGKGGDEFCPLKQWPAREEKIKKLINDVIHSGDTSRKANRMHHWNTNLGRLRQQLEHLQKMKSYYGGPEAAGDDCKKTDEAMLARVRAAADAKSVKAVVESRHQADKDGNRLAAAISAQDTIGGEMDQLFRNLKTFDFDDADDGAWKRVARDLHKTGGVVLLQWQIAWGRARKACVEPAKGEQYPRYYDVENKFFEDGWKQLQDDYATWRDATVGTYNYDCESMKQLHKNYCDELDGDEEETTEAEQFKKQAEEMKVEMKKKVEARLLALAPLFPRATELIDQRNGAMGTVEAFRAWRDTIAALSSKLGKHRQSLQGSLTFGISKGFTSPEIRLWIEFGKQRHTAMEKDPAYACDLKDQEFCAERNASGTCVRKKRPDCVSIAKNCTIFEFKPPGDAAKARGEKQLRGDDGTGGYKAILELHYNKAIELDFKTPVGGRAYVKKLAETCAPSGKIEFNTQVVQYERCQAKDGKPLEYTCVPPPGE